MLIPDRMKIYFYTQPVDMRKSIDTLCVMITEILHMNPIMGQLFLFRNKRGNKLKALYYETNCFTLLYRRLEKGRFVFPKNSEGAIEITKEHLWWLLASDKYSRIDALQSTSPESFF